MTDDPKALIRDEALRLGFDAVGFAEAEASEQAKAGLARFLAEGMHGDMGWMADKADRRMEPRALWPEARSAVVLGIDYGPGTDPMSILDHGDRGAISVYARTARDYHDVVKGRLKQLGRWMGERFDCQLKVFVDTAPLMEKPLAQAAGIGWQGKHTNLVARGRGSWLFLGVILTTLDLAADPAEADHCGRCRRCLDICPTDAFPEPYRLDARRCISYLTIEHKGPIPRDLRPLMGNRIYGCDDCLAVCPWNKFAGRTREPGLMPRAELTAPRLADLAELDDAAFRTLFAGSPIKRTGRARFLRNVLIAIGNSGEPELAPVARRRLDDDEPLVRGAAVWALSRLLPPAELAALSVEHAAEPDMTVRREWVEAGRTP